eukprot:ctg_345.g98
MQRASSHPCLPPIFLLAAVSVGCFGLRTRPGPLRGWTLLFSSHDPGAVDAAVGYGCAVHADVSSGGAGEQGGVLVVPLSVPRFHPARPTSGDHGRHELHVRRHAAVATYSVHSAVGGGGAVHLQRAHRVGSAGDRQPAHVQRVPPAVRAGGDVVRGVGVWQAGVAARRACRGVDDAGIGAGGGGRGAARLARLPDGDAEQFGHRVVFGGVEKGLLAVVHETGRLAGHDLLHQRVGGTADGGRLLVVGVAADGGRR